MKTFESKCLSIRTNSVYILPLRNENVSGPKNLLHAILFVYILPLRNENKEEKETHENDLKFISYL